MVNILRITVHSTVFHEWKHNASNIMSEKNLILGMTKYIYLKLMFKI